MSQSAKKRCTSEGRETWGFTDLHDASLPWSLAPPARWPDGEARGTASRYQYVSSGLPCPSHAAQLVHLAVRIEAGAVPVDEGADGHGVSQVVQAGTRAATARGLALPQADLLADAREVVLRRSLRDPLPMLSPEERRCVGCAKGPIPQRPVARQAFGGARGDRNRPVPVVLGMPDMQRGFVGVHVHVIESHGLANPKSGDRQQAEHGRVGGTAQAVSRRQPRCPGDDASHLFVRVDVRLRPPAVSRDEAWGRHQRSRLQALQPAGEGAHMAEPVGPGLPVRRPGALDLPAQEKLRRHMSSSLVRREGGEPPQFPNRTGRQAGSEGLPLGRDTVPRRSATGIIVPLPAPATGRASGRSAPWSYLA